VAETTGLLNRRTGHSVPGVRIPLSPQILANISRNYNRGVVQLVVCLVWDQEVVGSSPATPTKKPVDHSIYWLFAFTGLISVAFDLIH
jgi:hypothetical protein